MEFWGIEVKSGQPIKADPGANYVIHLSQASLGESKNKAESVPLYVNVDGKKLILGTLSHQICPQLSFDLVFDEEFELSHNWKNGSVYFLGMSSEEESEEEEDEELPMSMDESSDDEDEETPKKVSSYSLVESSKKIPVESSKKRPAEAATPASAKKAKSAVTPQKTDGKKGGHTATPHPAKQSGKNSAKSPKSGGQFSCGSCNSFGSEGGLESHKKAKHGGK
ncbi:hypothetical protein GOBAR_AA37657 [Gossypium barbadense]|uniref:Nucleoplasmin-like domain-containing protein n=1 Tax=Gossypium barbadense TaxID=3634 RepID=A0A2P5VW44_GOSBA|nr:hypothetical protein GOBAR_AA37657 [Gossypium barbadense]